MTVIMIYCDYVNIINSKLNMGTETNYCGIGQACVHYGFCPGSDFIEDEVVIKTEVSDSALDKGKIDINLLEVINLRDIEDKTNKGDPGLVPDKHSNEGKSDDEIGPNLKSIFSGNGEHDGEDGVVHHSVVVCKVTHAATPVLLQSWPCHNTSTLCINCSCHSRLWVCAALSHRGKTWN